jgi:hypothetical protein
VAPSQWIGIVEPQNLRPSFGGYPFPFSRIWIWSKKASPSALISSPNLARRPPTVSLCAGPQEETRTRPRTDEHLGSSSANSTQIPTGHPHQSVQFASPPGQSLREFVIKQRFFSAFCFLSLPPPPAPFSFLTPPAGRSGPLIAVPDCVFTRKGAVLGGRRSRIRLRRRRFDPEVRFFPQFSFRGIRGKIFRFSF